MRWILLDLLLTLLALGALGALTLSLWRKVKALGREVSRAGASVGAATDALSRAQNLRPGPGSS